VTKARLFFSQRVSTARCRRLALHATALAIAVAAVLGPGIGAEGGDTARAQTVAPALPGASNNLQVSTASYLGSTGTVATAVDVAPDGSTVLGGVLLREPGDGGDLLPAGAPTAVSLLGGGNGVVVRLAPPSPSQPSGVSGASGVLSLTRIGGSVEDVKVGASGAIAACGDFGVAVLDGSAGAVQWSATPGAVRRCAFGDDGTVVALAGASAFVYAPGGALTGSWTVGGTAQSDVALDATRGLVYVAGYNNRRTPQGEPVQVAYLKAWTYNGTPAWTAYDAPADRLGAWFADTRGVRVALGRDGRLYFAAESAGGNSIFSRQPRNVSQPLRDEQLVRMDAFSNPFNTPNNHITWLGRYDPADGSLEMGQFVLARLDYGNRRGNTIRPRAITADEEGRVYLVGVTNASIQDRDVRTISGAAVGPYAGGEAFLLVLQPDLRQRVVWTTFTAPSPPSADPTHDSVAVGIGVRNGVAALAATINRGALLTYNPLPAPPGAVPLSPSAPPTAGTPTASGTAGSSGSAGAPPATGAAAGLPAAAPSVSAVTQSGAAVPSATAATRPAAAPATGSAPSTPGGQTPGRPSPAPAAVVGAAPHRAYVAVWQRSGEGSELSVPGTSLTAAPAASAAPFSPAGPGSSGTLAGGASAIGSPGPLSTPSILLTPGTMSSWMVQ
jgi:hypothetical protein